jgi:putative transposase
MPDYRRYWVPGGTYFFTLATHQRSPLFADAGNVQRLREALAIVQGEQAFSFLAAVVLPDHMHFIWTLPAGDSDYARRIGRMKVLFTRRARAAGRIDGAISASRKKHRESDLWQRRFWEHTLASEDELPGYLDYIHYNPVKHGWAGCPHAWKASSFQSWVSRGLYELEWGCCCQGRKGSVPLPQIERQAGEP